MATPITHIALTAKIFDKFFKDKIRSDFFIGSSFPDIRYLNVIEREKTHFEHLTIADLKNDNAFVAGLKFHSIVDFVHEEFMLENGIYLLCPQSKYIKTAIKLLEDELCYDQVLDWQQYIGYLNKISTDEIGMGVSSENIIKWHSLLQDYFQAGPNKLSITNFMHGIYFKDDAIQEMLENLNIIRTDKKILNILKKFIENFDALIEQTEKDVI